MQFQKDWKLSSPSAPIFKGLFGTLWAIPSGPSMPRPLKAYIGQQQQLAVSQLPFAESVIDLILDYCCAANDYLLVFSTPFHDIFDLWALWADCGMDILSVQDYKLRFLDSWDYKYLMLCTTGLSVPSWIELIVESNDYYRGDFGRDVSLLLHGHNRIHSYIRVAVKIAQFQPRRMGKWLIDGGNRSIPLFDAMSLV